MADIKPVMGEYRHNIDAKNRVFVPAKHREALGELLVVYPNIRNKSLKVCSVDQWKSINDRINSLPAEKREALNRFFNSTGDTFEPDTQGRITLSKALVDHAGLTGTVVIIGCGTTAEIWSEKEYGAMKASMDMDLLLAAAEDADV